MPFDSYSALQTSIAGWLMGRDDLTAVIPDFITLAESRLNRVLRVREMETTTTLTPASNVCTLPSDFIEARRVVANSSPQSVLEPITPDYAIENYSTNVSGSVPLFYTIVGSSLTAYPLSDSTVSLVYYRTLPALTSTNTSNWLLSKAPDLYLYGSLIEAAPYLEDDARLQTWTALFQAGVQTLISADTRAVYGRASARIRGATP